MKLEKDIVALNKFRSNKELSDETRRRIRKQLDEAESRFDMKKEELNTIVFRLIDSEIWPSPPRTSSDDADYSNIREEKFKEVRVMVLALRDKVKELSDMMEKQSSDVSLLKGSGKFLPQTSEDEPRPAKRRRLSSAEPTMLVDEPQASSSRVEITNQKDLDSLTDRISALESKVVDLENDWVQYDNDLSASLEDRIEEKFAELGGPSSSQQKLLDLTDTGQPPNVPLMQRLSELQTEFDQAGKDIEEVAKEVGTMISHAHEVDEEIARMKAENETLKQRITTVSDTPC